MITTVESESEHEADAAALGLADVVEIEGDVLEAPIPRADELELATVLGALSDPIRLRIIAELASGGERICGSFELPVAKSTCSHHFRVLREAGLICQRIEGKNRFNRLRRDALDQRFPGLLDAVLSARATT